MLVGVDVVGLVADGRGALDEVPTPIRVLGKRSGLGWGAEAGATPTLGGDVPAGSGTAGSVGGGATKFEGAVGAEGAEGPLAGSRATAGGAARSGVAWAGEAPLGSSSGANCATESAHAGVGASVAANRSRGFRVRFIQGLKCSADWLGHPGEKSPGRGRASPLNIRAGTVSPGCLGMAFSAVGGWKPAGESRYVAAVSIGVVRSAKAVQGETSVRVSGGLGLGFVGPASGVIHGTAVLCLCDVVSEVGTMPSRHRHGAAFQGSW